jgi:hypothetical protein
VLYYAKVVATRQGSLLRSSEEEFRASGTADSVDRPVRNSWVPIWYLSPLKHGANDRHAARFNSVRWGFGGGPFRARTEDPADKSPIALYQTRRIVVTASVWRCITRPRFRQPGSVQRARYPSVMMVTLLGVSTWVTALIDPMPGPSAAEQRLVVPAGQNSKMTSSGKINDYAECQDDHPERNRYREPQPSQPSLFVVAFFQMEPRRRKEVSSVFVGPVGMGPVSRMR